MNGDPRRAAGRIERLLDDVVSIKRHRLVTLERAQMHSGEIDPVA